ncbi:MAG: OmpA family protein [Spirochaetota bacterium]
MNKLLLVMAVCITVGSTVESAEARVKENLGAIINSKHDDRLPIISPDGRTLYFIRMGSPENSDRDIESTDIWYSEKDAKGRWTKAKNIGKPLNNDAPNAVLSAGMDNNSLLLLSTYNSDGSTKGNGISYSYRTKDGWAVPEEVVIDYFYNKHPEYSGYCLSQDWYYLIASVERDDSLGDTDLYVSFKVSDKKYSRPKNLGRTLNTSGKERTPFLAADNKTLYFSSDRPGGRGDMDIYVTRRLDNTWTNWSAPENLGPEFNTDGWDGYFSIPASGSQAYLVSSTGSLGMRDIFRIAMPDVIKPLPVVLVQGVVQNKKSGEPVDALIQYYDLTNGVLIGSAIADPANGRYSIILQSGKRYAFRAEKKDFYAVNENLDVSVLTEYTEIEQDLMLVPIESGQTVRMNNIFFEYNKSDLHPESKEELNRVVALLRNNSTMKLEIAGHTDNVGGEAYNRSLSQARAAAVARYFVSAGIQSGRLTAKGYGQSKPVVANTSDAGRKQNRRVEFVIQ